jgi:hypothetical protein
MGTGAQAGALGPAAGLVSCSCRHGRGGQKPPYHTWAIRLEPFARTGGAVPPEQRFLSVVLRLQVILGVDSSDGTVESVLLQGVILRQPRLALRNRHRRHCRLFSRHVGCDRCQGW